MYNINIVVDNSTPAKTPRSNSSSDNEEHHKIEIVEKVNMDNDKLSKYKHNPRIERDLKSIEKLEKRQVIIYYIYNDKEAYHYFVLNFCYIIFF